MKVNSNFFRKKIKSFSVKVLIIFALGCSSKLEPSALGPRIAKEKVEDVSSATPTPQKAQTPLNTRYKRKIPVPAYVKNWEEVYERTSYFIFANEYLWLLGSDRIEVNGPNFSKDIYYQSFAEHPCPKKKKRGPYKNPDGLFVNGLALLGNGNCIPLPKLYGVPSFTATMLSLSTDRYPPQYYHAQGFGFLENQVYITLDDGVYFFKPSGEFIEKRKEDEWWAVKDGPYGTTDWRIDSDNKLFYKKKEISADRGKAFSGPIVAVFDSSKVEVKGKKYPHLDKMNLTFFDRKDGKKKTIFPGLKKISSRQPGMLVREYGNGFYVDKYEKTKRKKYYLNSIYRPMFWFGEKTIDLRSEIEQFCYVFKEERKCIPNPDYWILEVVEDDHALYVITYNKIYVKRREPGD